jgi:hypothetical protein
MFTENIITASAAFPMMENSSPLMASSSLNRVQRTSPSQHQDWDAQVVGYPNFSFFHSAAWAKVLTGTYGYAPVYFITSEGGQVQSLLPLMEVDSWLTGRRGIALPFTDDCEPLVNEAVSFKELFQSAIEFGKSRGWKYIECRGGKKFFGEIPASLSFFGHSLNLTPGADCLFSRLDGSVRRAIRKAEKDGVTVQVSQSLEAVQAFYSLQCKTRKKHGLPPQPVSFFLNIHKHILSENKGIVVLASHQGRIIAAAVYFHMAGRAVYKFGASDEAFQHLRGNNLVMWEAIKWFLCNGVTELHLGRTSLSNEGLRRYKLAWQADEEEIKYVKYNLRTDTFATDMDKSSGWHNRVFQKLPVFASRIVGDALYKHWA